MSDTFIFEPAKPKPGAVICDARIQPPIRLTMLDDHGHEVISMDVDETSKIKGRRYRGQMVVVVRICTEGNRLVEVNNEQST